MNDNEEEEDNTTWMEQTAILWCLVTVRCMLVVSDGGFDLMKGVIFDFG